MTPDFSGRKDRVYSSDVEPTTHEMSSSKRSLQKKPSVHPKLHSFKACHLAKIINHHCLFIIPLVRPCFLGKGCCWEGPPLIPLASHHGPPSFWGEASSWRQEKTTGISLKTHGEKVPKWWFLNQIKDTLKVYWSLGVCNSFFVARAHFLGVSGHFLVLQNDVIGIIRNSPSSRWKFTALNRTYVFPFSDWTPRVIIL